MSARPSSRASGKRDDYAWAKGWQERVVCELGAAGPCEVTIVRPGAVHGPGRDFPARLGRRIGERAVLLLGGAAAMPLIQVDNLASLLAECAEQPGAGGLVLNAIDRDPPRQWTYLRRWRRAQPGRIVVVPLPRALLRAAGGPVALTRGALPGPRPRRALRDGARAPLVPLRHVGGLAAARLVASARARRRARADLRAAGRAARAASIRRRWWRGADLGPATDRGRGPVPRRGGASRGAAATRSPARRGGLTGCCSSTTARATARPRSRRASPAGTRGPGWRGAAPRRRERDRLARRRRGRRLRLGRRAARRRHGTWSPSSTPTCGSRRPRSRRVERCARSERPRARHRRSAARRRGRRRRRRRIAARRITWMARPSSTAARAGRRSRRSRRCWAGTRSTRSARGSAGWAVRSVDVPGGDPRAAAARWARHDGLLRGYRRWGRCAWGFGEHPLHVLAVARAAARRPAAGPRQRELRARLGVRGAAARAAGGGGGPRLTCGATSCAGCAGASPGGRPGPSSRRGRHEPGAAAHGGRRPVPRTRRTTCPSCSSRSPAQDRAPDDLLAGRRRLARPLGRHRATLRGRGIRWARVLRRPRRRPRARPDGARARVAGVRVGPRPGGRAVGRRRQARRRPAARSGPARRDGAPVPRRAAARHGRRVPLAAPRPTGGLCRQRCPPGHVEGPNRFYRRACLEAISPVPADPRLGHDRRGAGAPARLGRRGAIALRRRRRAPAPGGVL